MSTAHVQEEQKPVDKLSYNEIASKLIHDRFLLTALELHTELIESGRELKQLKDFFSNPGNFETTQEPSSRISRSGSQVTLDSLDLTRFSEDGTGIDEKVAVLEFELRKAKETINALRNNLTIATESETSTPDKGSLRNVTIKPHEQRALNFLINEYLLQHGYKLTSITFADENQDQDFDDWDDVGLNIPKPPELYTLYRDGLKQTGSNSISVSTQTESLESRETNSELREQIKVLETKIEELKESSVIEIEKEKVKEKEGSESPEQFEIIDKLKSESITTLEDNISNNSFNTSDWLNVHNNVDVNKKEPFVKEVFSTCYLSLLSKVDVMFENNLNESISSDNLVHCLSQALLKIIPNIILNKREEVIPLLVNAVHLNPEAGERDKLLQQLFNLKKKPSENERVMILSGLLAIAKISGESLVENEILPQCWLQLTDKYVERRLLVVEACTCLIPYVSSQIRNSLILSMLQQLLDDKDESIRESVIKALSLLLVLCSDPDKYNQCEQLALSTLNDTSPRIVNASTQILFPVLGKWAFNNSCLISSLLKNLLQKFNEYLKDSDNPSKLNQVSDKILRIVNVLENLLPFLMMAIASHPKVLTNIEKDHVMEIRADFLKLCSSLTNPEKFFKSPNPGMVIFEFDKLLAEQPNSSWTELDWIMDMFLPDLLNNLDHIETSQQTLLHSFMNLFSHICIIFGKHFTANKIRVLLESRVKDLEQILSSFNQYCPSLNLIPVYLVSVLSYCDLDELGIVLRRFLCVLPLCGAPLDCLEVTVRRLCEADLQELVVDALWEGVVHQRPLVRASSAGLFSGIVGKCQLGLLRQKVAPALVTLASDSDILVRTAAVPALGNLITDCDAKEIHDKAYMQLQSYLADNASKENHMLLRQLVVTLGNIVNSCSGNFKNDVVIPHLCNLTVGLPQMPNQIRKVDLAQALIEALTNIVYSPLNKQSFSNTLLPGLRCLESIVNENQSLSGHRETISMMIRECDNKTEPQMVMMTPDRSKLSQNVNQSVEEVRQRVSKIFNKPSPNLAMFKKK